MMAKSLWRVHRYARRALLVPALIGVALLAAPAYRAQQPFDEERIVAEMRGALQLDEAQVGRLRELLAEHRAAFARIGESARKGTPPNEVRAAMDRERRAVAEALMPALRPEQQARVRAFLANAPGAPAPPGSPILPLKPNLASGPLAAGERLIPLPRTQAVNHPASRSRRVASAPPTLTEEQRVLHLLNRAGFGPRPGDVERVMKMGLDHYLDEQLHPETIADEFLSEPMLAFGTLQLSTPEILQAFAPPPPMPRPTPTPAPAANNKAAQTPNAQGEAGAPPKPQTPPQPTPAPTPPRPPRNQQQPLQELQQAKLLRAIFSERQLQEVMTDFWMNHFNVFGGKDADRWLLTSYERDVIRPHALGKFRDLLLATAQSPAMLFYLDNFMSQADGARPPRLEGPPRNVQGAKPAALPNASQPVTPQPGRRGLNENYAREIMELHTLGVDGGYTQRDVQEVARCLTGWSLTPPQNGAAFVFRAWAHDRGEKTVLGTRIPAGGGIEDGLRVIDLLAKHPSTAHFIARKLAQRFVADEPPTSLVERAANVFTQTDGDIRAVVRAILTSPEFYAPQQYRAKVKSPLELVASAVRATGATTDAAQPLVQWVARLGEPLYLCQPPTGYSEESGRWLSAATLLERMNFAAALAQNRINGTRVDVGRFLNGDALADQNAALDRLLALLIHSDVAPPTREQLTRTLTESQAKLVPATFEQRANAKNTEPLLSGITALILGSREFQVK